MAEKKTSLGHEFSKGIIAENPVFRLVLGTCPALAISTSVENAIGMGIAATIVLVLSNMVISALRKVIPDKVRIPSYIVVIASFVTMIQLFVKAYAPTLDKALGIYLPLIVVNCIILGRAEAFANKNKIFPSALDGLGMGVGFTLALVLMAMIREFFGTGKLTLKVLGHGIVLTASHMEPIIIFILAPGGFFVFGLLVALTNHFAKKKGASIADINVCTVCEAEDGCPAKAGTIIMPEVDIKPQITKSEVKTEVKKETEEKEDNK